MIRRLKNKKLYLVICDRYPKGELLTPAAYYHCRESMTPADLASHGCMVYSTDRTSLGRLTGVIDYNQHTREFYFI